MLTQRTMSMGAGAKASSVLVPLSLVQATIPFVIILIIVVTYYNNEWQSQYARDAFSKAIYSNLFQWIVERINKKIRYRSRKSTIVGDNLPKIGILDIYGFEIFENNSFEQLCINYCNEKLQQLFIELTLKSEQEEYLREGIEWEPIQYFNNKVICDLIEAKPKGLVTLMDECVALQNNTDELFLQKAERCVVVVVCLFIYHCKH